MIEKYQSLIESFPERIPLDTKIIYIRKMCGYEEWKIEYTAECPDTMPEPSGRRISAYLLVPTAVDKDEYTSRYPAMVCFHQCFCDCDIGKEAVVGKVVDRPDQAYGYELVKQGFVVIAPDAINCGERNIPSIRQEGVRILSSICGSQLSKSIGRVWAHKTILDGMRAVDLLQSLDFVDSDRIGAIGHSMGAHQTFLTMACDQRIKAGVVSGFDGRVHGLCKDYREGLASLTPRLFMQLHGSYDGSPERIQKIVCAHDFANRIYEEANAPENLILRIYPCHHHFLDNFKWAAYTKLKQYFGIMDTKKLLLLEDALRNARERISWAWAIEEGKNFPNIKSTDKHYVKANIDKLTNAFSAIFIHLCQKRPHGSSLIVNVHSDKGNCYVVCSITGGNDEVKVAHSYYYLMRQAEQLLFENSAALTRENTPDQIKYVITFPKNQ